MTCTKTVLLAEDIEDDVYFFKRAFNRMAGRCDLQVVEDGEEVVQYLSGEGKYADRRMHPLPWLIFLDIKLPRRDGFQVLRWIRSHSTLRRVPVLILTSSNQRIDIDQAYELGANTYFVKPTTFERLDQMITNASKYWFEQSTVAVAQIGH